MQQISSRGIFFQKVIFPLLLLLYAGFMFVGILATSHQKFGPPRITLIAPVLIVFVGYYILKKTVWDLADRVFDAGDLLIVRFGKEEDRIPLSNVINISYSKLMTPTRITLTLHTPGRFGSEISFAAPFSPWTFSRSRIITDLIQRVDAARRAAGASF
jgi:hypothetical protein